MLRITAATSPSVASIAIVENSPPAPTGINSAAALNSLNFSVAILERDAAVLASLSRLVRAAGYAARTFSTAREFLAQHDPTVPGCSILDLSISGMGGLQLQAELTARGSRQPVIFITRKADVRASVQAMKAGAVDVLTQPVDEDALLAALACAAEREAKERRRNVEMASISARLAKLTPRELEVLSGVVVGRLNKQIAASLGVTEKNGQGSSRPHDAEDGRSKPPGSRSFDGVDQLHP